MRAAATLGVALAATLFALPKAWAQTPYPDLTIQDVTWTDGVQHYAVSQPILSPSTSDLPVEIGGTVDAEFVSGTQVRLRPGFHAGGLSGAGRFHAYIDTDLGAAGDVVIISPDVNGNDQYGGMVDNVIHVHKWEKVEVGLRLPQDYQDAINSFFEHYYPYPDDPLDPDDDDDPYISAPGNVDDVHALNPYADDSLQLVMTLTNPAGQQYMKWGFYMKEAKWNSTSFNSTLSEDLVDPLHPYHVRFRFSPDTIGPWQFSISLKAPHTASVNNDSLPELSYSGYGFVCDPPLPENHGPLAVDTLNRRMLRFADGTPFFGLGTNMGAHHNGTGWSDPNVYRIVRGDYDAIQQSMVQLHDVGGNFMRMFLMRHSFAPEWVNLGVYDAYSAILSCDPNSPIPTVTGNGQCDSWVLDQVLDSVRSHNIYIQLCIDPYPPIVGYQSDQWGAHPYFLNFLKPHRQTPPANPYDLKEFFYTRDSLGVRQYNSGVFYYWKRRYKYIMSRWGYSVNLPIIEPFNEIDQMLSFHTDSTTSNCPENILLWEEDTALPGTYNDWLTDIIGFVKDPVDLDHPVTSSLGEDRKLFLTGIGGNPNTTNPDYYLACMNPKLDLIDVHTDNQWEWSVRNNFDNAQAFRDSYVSAETGDKRPFHYGEYTTYAHRDLIVDTVTKNVETLPFFNNYSLSFHNELWASTFYGGFAAGSSWAWYRVFWWNAAMPSPPSDGNNIHWYSSFQQFSTAHGQWNVLKLGPGLLDTVRVQNRRVHHHFRALADFLAKPAVQELFNGDFSVHRHFYEPDTSDTDEDRKIECYWLLREPERDMAVGWVHNMNAFWLNSFYLRSDVQRYLQCEAPNAQSIELSGLAQNTDFYISWFPTHLNDTICPVDTSDFSQTGSVTLDLTSAPFSGQIGTPLDTLHTDYAFIIAPEWVKSLQFPTEVQTKPRLNGWDFELYPNPARDEVFLRLPDDGHIDVTLLDLSGRSVRTWSSVKGPLVHLSIGELSKGIYWVRASTGTTTTNKKLILH